MYLLIVHCTSCGCETALIHVFLLSIPNNCSVHTVTLHLDTKRNTRVFSQIDTTQSCASNYAFVLCMYKRQKST